MLKHHDHESVANLRSEDMDRDSEGHLTDLGRSQLVAWHDSIGLLHSESERTIFGSIPDLHGDA